MAADQSLSPLGAWDTGHPFYYEHMREISEWATEHIPDVYATYRVEFFLIDAPFARNEDGELYLDVTGKSAATAEPDTLLLSELPPRHLLDGSMWNHVQHR